MSAVVVALSIEAIPIGVLISAAHDRSLRRRSRFRQRFAAIVIAIALPDLVVLVAPVGEQTFVLLMWLGLAWGILLVVLASFVLFHGLDFGPESGDDDDQGPGPEDGGPTPRPPTGRIPLPDAEPSLARVRDHHPPRRAPRPRRPVRVPERSPSRLWRLRLLPRARFS